MKLTVLMEDTQGACDVICEHGLSLYIETKKHKLLSDTGASEKTILNAKALGVDLSKVDTVILSHGHYDHSGGLLAFSEINSTATVYMRRNCFGEYYNGERYIGVDKKIMELKNLYLIENEIQIDDELCVFSKITGDKLYPRGNYTLLEKINNEFVPDKFTHEQCICINENGKLFLISGCAHTGIINILERFNLLFGRDPDFVISGFHMMKKAGYNDEDVEVIKQTAEILKNKKTIFYTGHCTTLPAYDIMKDIMTDNLIYFHSGDSFEF